MLALTPAVRLSAQSASNIKRVLLISIDDMHSPELLATSAETFYYGPGFASVDFSVFKTILITERVRMEFRAEIFNLFNRTNWANPGVTFTSCGFGQLTQTSNGGSAPGLGFGEPRNTQVALKILW